MLVVLAAVGVGLVVLGGIVLLRFPDRPGGDVRMLGMEVSSIGAGLPLVALGLAAVVFAATQQGDGATSTSSGGSGGGGGGGAPLAPANTPPCMLAFFEREPVVPEGRRRALAAEREDVDVLAPAEPKLDEFGLVLTDAREVLGAVKMTYDTDAEQFGLDGVIDDRCSPVGWTASNASGPDPDPVNNFGEIHFTFGGHAYFIELKANTEAEMELHRFVR